HSSSVLREAEHALAQDVLEDLGRSGADAARAGEQFVELPLPVVGRPLGALRDLGVRPDDLGGRERQVRVELAPEELGGRALGAGLAAAPVSWRSGGFVMPGVFMSTSRKLIPLCLGASGLVRTSRKHQSATCAIDVQTFWPLTTKCSPSSTPRVWRLARSEPAFGSENPWHHSSSAVRIFCRCRVCWAGVPYFISVGPSIESPPRLMNWGDSARAISWKRMICSVSGAPRPPNSFGQLIPT